MFIAIEGADGVGKTTQSEKLCTYLDSCGHNTKLTKEPGGTKIGVLLRDMALSFGFEITSNTTRIVLLADHTEHMETVVMPALKGGMTVISDRGINSALVYQGLAKKEYVSTRSLYNNASYEASKVVPEVVVWIDLDPKEAVKRLKKRKGKKHRHDSKPFDWHKQIRDTYSYIFNEGMYIGDRYLRVDGKGSMSEVHRRIKDALNE